MANNLTLTDVNMTQSHGPKSSMPTNVLDGQILLGRTDGKPTEQFAGTASSVESLANAEWKNVHGDITKNSTLQDALKASNGQTNIGELNFNEQGIKNVYNMKHSSFGASKFTVAGSPIVKSDGIAEGFSGHNYLTIPTFKANNTYKISFIMNTKNYKSGQQWQSPYSEGRISYISNGIYTEFNTESSVFRFVIGNGSQQQSVSVANIQEYTTYKVDFEFDGTLYKLYLDGILKTSATATILRGDTTSTITMIGGSYEGSNTINSYPFNGSVDLKSISIIADAVEVFNGNKAGIDTIKPDDYMVVGTPTITDDGVASGLSSSNYLTANTNIEFTKNLLFKGSCIIGSLPSGFEPIVKYGNIADYASGIIIAYMSDKRALVGLIDASSNTTQIFSNTTYEQGDKLDWEITSSNNGLTYNVKFYKNNVLVELSTPTTLSNAIPDIDGKTLFGKYATNEGDTVFTGSIDLNSFKIYIDGSLVYQPCLKMPYTESSDLYGSKVVDYIYRDRVLDAYQQGYTNTYYTLQESQVNNYAITGSPTISNNIVSNLSNTNYINANLAQITLDKLDFYGQFKTSSTLNVTQYIMAIASDSNNNNSLVRLAIDANKKIGVGCHNNTTWTAYWSSANYIEANKTYLYHLYYTGGHIKLDVSTDSLTYINVIDQAVTASSSYAQNKLWIGATGATNDTYFRGTIDLSLIKQIYDNNDITIVTKPNFTLPCGNIYGRIDTVIEDNLDKINQSKALITGNTSDYLIVYKEIEKAYHSTFDRSKFTVVSSPTITDDGIASGFSSSNYIDLSSVVSNISSLYTSVIYDIEFTTSNDVSADQRILAYNGLSFYLTVHSGYIRFYYAINNTGWSKSGVALETAIANTTYKYQITFTQTGATISGDSLANPVNVTDGKIYVLPNRLGWGATTTGWTGSIDLKQFSITVDGVPVFSGNKTGIDTIKADDYTVVGTPTISADGVASGFSNANYLTATATFTDEYDIYISGTLLSKDTSLSNYGRLLQSSDSGETFRLYCYPINNGDVLLELQAYSSGAMVFNISKNLGNASIGTIINVDIKYKNGTYYLYYKLNGSSEWILGGQQAAANVLSGSQTFVIGASNHTASRQFLGSIDLNAFKIYVDGSLVYQSCLKIPYTWSSDESKIVDNAYYSRVKDAYEQGYHTYDYFTIDEENKVFSLPQGEFYGMIASKQIENQNNTTGINAVKQYKALETGNTANLPNVYEDIYKYKHSSFDASKFNVVGSPTISADGIASGFSSSNYIYTAECGLSTANSFEITFPVKVLSSAPTTNKILWGLSSSSPNYFYLYCEANTNNYILRGINNSSVSLSPNNDYLFKWIRENNTDTLLYKNINSANWTTIVSSQAITTTVGNNIFKIGNRSAGDDSAYAWTGSIDLKQFSITVDGVEVFSGNQTGIDIIKPNDFTSVTGLFAYKYTGGVEDTVYADASSNPTNLYNANGSYYTGSYYILVNDTVNYLNYAEYSSADNIIIGSTTYYAFKYDTHIIYANSSTSPTALYNNDGTAYTGTDWRLYQNTIAYLSPATYTQSSNIALSIQNATVDAGVKITDDGVVSGLSSSNYIVASIPSLASATNFEIDIEIVAYQNATGNWWPYILADSQGADHGLSIRRWGSTLSVRCNDNNNIVSIDSTKLNKKYKVNIKSDGTVKFYKEGELIDIKTLNVSTMQSWSGTLDLGNRRAALTTSDFPGSIDLNSFKIYVDGDLVYQPMLKIPYTQSAVRYGSKVVDNYYKNRVQDAYDQNFSYRYYIIDEDNKTFNLPMGELYGMLEQRVQSSDLREVKCVIDTYRSGNDWYRVWSDGWCEQGGQANENVDVAFLKPFTNTNYTITATRQFSSDNNNITYYDKRTNYIQFRVSNDATGSSVISWMACGYIA